MSALEGIKNMHPSSNLPTTTNTRFMTLCNSPTARGFHLTFTLCPSHSGVSGNELAGEAISEPQIGKLTVVKEGPSLRQQTEERPSSGLEILVLRFGRVLDTVCQNCGMVETIEHSIEECPQIHHPATQIPERDQPP